MTIPAAFTSGLARDRILPFVWVEFEGLPYAYGTRSADGNAFFVAGRDIVHQREAVRGVLASYPTTVAQEVTPIEGHSSIGAMTLEIMDDSADEVVDSALFVVFKAIYGHTALDLIGGVGRTDKLLPMQPSNAWLPTHAYSVGDLVRPTGASAAAGALYWFRCSTAGTSAASEPAWPTGGTIADGTAVFTTMGPGDLSADTTGIYIPYAGTALDADYPVGGGLLYVGRETIGYSSKVTAPNGGGYFTGLARCIYQLDGFNSYQAHSRGDLISPYPRFLFGRRVSVYMTTDGTDALPVGVEANKVCIWAGTVASYAFKEGLGVLEVRLNSIEAEIKTTVFSNQRKARLKAGLTDANGVYAPRNVNEPDWTQWAVTLDPDTYKGQTWTNGEHIYVRIDGEIFQAQIVGTSTPDAPSNLNLVLDSGKVPGGAPGYDAQRGLFGTDRLQHSPGAEVKEVIPTFAKQGTTGQYAYSKFTSDHPFDILRAFLASDNPNAAQNGVYDILPNGWGVGVDDSRIDNAEIDALKKNWLPDERWVEVIEAPFVVKEKLAEILKPYCCYPVAKLGNVLSFRRINPPMPDSTYKAIDTNALQVAPTWDGGVETVVGRVIYSFDWDPIYEKFYGQRTAEIQGQGVEAQEFYANLYRTIQVEMRGQFLAGADGVPGSMGALGGTRAGDLIDKHLDLVLSRFGRPGPFVVAVVSFDYLTIEVGDLVQITEPNTPNIATGGRGLTAVTFEVQRKQVDYEHGQLILTLQQTYFASLYRLIAPAATVNAFVAGTKKITVNAHDFTEASAAADASHFAIGDKIASWAPDLSALHTDAGIVSDVTGNVITLSSYSIGDPVNGDIIMPSDYDTAVAAQRAKHAFLCGSASPQTVGVATKDAAHQYAE